MWDASLAPLLAEPLGPWRAAVSDLILAPFCGCDRNGLLYDGAAEPGSVPRTAPRRAREGAPVTAGSGLSPTVAAPSVEAQPLRAQQQPAPRRASPGGHRAACRSRAVQPSPASWLRSSLLGSEAGFSKHWRLRTLGEDASSGTRVTGVCSACSASHGSLQRAQELAVAQCGDSLALSQVARESRARTPAGFGLGSTRVSPTRFESVLYV